jgi:hypothetical protein
MTAGDRPETKADAPAPGGDTDQSIQIQARPTAPVVSIKSSGAATQPQTDRVLVETRRLDQAMVVLTLVLGFFLASFTATNSDLWMHLASGRLIAHGQFQFPFADDPFAFTVDKPWLNHNWLYDWLLYGLSQAAGGAESAEAGVAMVLAKAVVVVALAWVMLQIRRPDGSAWIPTVCVSLALLALSPRLLLQPTCISMLFLGLTLWLLQPPSPRPEAELSALGPVRRWLASPQRVYALPVLFVLWVNLDTWFLLGPFVVGMYLLGEFLRNRVFATEVDLRAELRRLAIVFVAGLAACAVNPYHVRAFAVPQELAAFLTDSPLQDDSRLKSFFLPSLTPDYFNLHPERADQPAFYQNMAACSYAVLLAVSLLSFVCNYKAVVSGRAAVFVPLAVLAAFWVRAIPFFAVVAGPIAALNFQDFAARLAEGSAEASGPARRWTLSGRLLTVVALLALLVLAWPGLLHPRGDDARLSRRVAWRVAINPSLRQSALALADLHRRGILHPDSRGLNLSADVANYLAWFCPEERAYLDFRIHLYDPEVQETYVKARKTLGMQRSPGERANAPQTPGEGGWQTPLRTHHIDHVILYDETWDNLRDPVVMRFWRDPRQWTMLYGDGRTAVFGWNDPKAREARFKEAVFDPVAAAFGPRLEPEEDRKPPAEASAAPGWWDWYNQVPQSRPLEVDHAAMHFEYYGVTQRQRQEEYTQRFLLSRFFGSSLQAAGMAATGAGPAAGPFLPTYIEYSPLAPRIRSSPASSAMPLLSFRTAREAVLHHPDDPDAQLMLARAIMLLARDQRELLLLDNPEYARLDLFLDEIRRVQLANILERCVLLKEDAPEPHRLLAEVYLQMHNGNPNYPTHLDKALTHRARWLELIRDAGPRPDETEEQYAAKMKALDKRVHAEISRHVSLRRQAGQLPGAALTGDEMSTPKTFLDRLREDYGLKAENRSLVEKIGIALQHGLADEALKLVDEMDADRKRKLSRDEASLIAAVSIRSGRAGDIGEEVLSDIKDEWLRVLKAAALGDYEGVDEHLAEFDRLLERQHQRYVLEWGTAPFGALATDPARFRSLAAITLQLARQKSNLRVVRTIMMLERGDTVRAKELFEKALRSTVPPRQIMNLAGALSAGQSLDVVTYMAAWEYNGTERRFEFEYAPMARAYLEHLEAGARTQKSEVRGQKSEVRSK